MKFTNHKIITLFIVIGTFFLGISEAVEGSKKNELSIIKSNCKNQDFSVFIKIFTENVDMQKNFINNPLKYIELVDATAMPLPKFSTRYLNTKELKYPIILQQNKLMEYGLKINFEKLSNNFYIVTERSLGEKSLGHFIEYKFSSFGKCWKLVEVTNQST